ncbi:bifunctional phosphoribosylaminoimidazolecarboxamide formyltransferase/IMP cyclohydrolase [bacterium]|nr:bifunctional phosphoribosylaminoimidazolecarboxamide formyltransferase/IMP cyclohydrolase [bacterium]
MKKGRALLSVSNKTGIVAFAGELASLGYEILSTGGTARLLQENGIAVVPVESVTGFPEMMGGRVKTLHPAIHGALLGRREHEGDRREAEVQGIEWIDIVAVNLYPFERTVAAPDVSLEEAVEQIDIGGPSMLRSSAKNFRSVTVVSDPDDYDAVLEEIKENGGTSLELRQRLAVKAFRRTADYDAAIDTYLSRVLAGEPVRRLAYTTGRTLRYGENSHQAGSFFRDPAVSEPSVAAAEVIHGKAMSYNNYVDADAAFEAVKELDGGPGVAVIKHTNPCGFATGKSGAEALERAWEGDPVSAFGSVIAANTVVDHEFAGFLKGSDREHTSYVYRDGALVPQQVPGKFVEVIVAPDFTDDALELLTAVKNIRLLKTGPLDRTGTPDRFTYRKITGGLLEMERDLRVFDFFNVVTEKQFGKNGEALALFACKACKHTKSNAIVLARAYRPGVFQVMGMGAGQPNRVDSLRKLAVTKARENVMIEYERKKITVPAEQYIAEQMAAMVMASDAFFPFDDTVREAASFGIRYIVQPGGSRRDGDSIAACDELGVAMALTGLRHFKH